VYVSSAAGDYLSSSVDSPCSKESGLAPVFDRNDGGVHLWLSLGARLALFP
jgi:hypothetical protein